MLCASSPHSVFHVVHNAIDIGDSSRAHYLIEEGSVEGDGSI
jgi:hypothetical protein